MGLRQGVTASEENRMKQLVSAGHSWEDIVSSIRAGVDDSKKAPTGVAFLDGADLKTVKTNFYDVFVKKLEAAKKAGFDTIHKHEASVASKARADAKAKADAADKK